MNPVDFDAFVSEHFARHPHCRLPKPGSDMARVYFDPWQGAFRALKVTPEVARAASVRMVHEPPDRVSNHWITLKRFCLEGMRAAGGDAVVSADTRDEALAASLGCPWCDGTGLTCVWHPSPSHAEKIPVTVAAYCGCRMGRWVKRAHERKEETRDYVKRTPDLIDIHNGRSVWLSHPPEMRDDLDERRTFRYQSEERVYAKR